ncbi:MAG: VanW family protein [Sandaracinaceae bacterium]|nr:VanW family protein [Sandaracinaceae bacterium]MDW8244949.1 VanW family protein [Sandaracinaceae bacterium]
MEPTSLEEKAHESGGHKKAPQGPSLAFLAWVLAGATGGLAYAEFQKSKPLPPALLRVDGMEVSPGSSYDIEGLIEKISADWESTPLRLKIEKEGVEASRSDWGLRVDRERLRRFLLQGLDPASAMQRYHALRKASPGALPPPLELPVPVAIDHERLLARLFELKDAFDRSASDARIEARTGKVISEVVGRSLDVFATFDALIRAAWKPPPEIEAVVIPKWPHRRADELREVRTEAILSAYETHYSTLEETRDRTHNLKLAASKIDGHVLMPGEVFDFNRVVGERSEANGFRPAPEIADGELVQGIGGGTCQIASTLHAAAFFAGIPILERAPHSRPSSYIWLGLDAVVIDGQQNLRFRNDYSFPIVIGMTVEGGRVRAEIRGRSAERTTTLIRRIEEVRPFRVREERDPSLPQGLRHLRQRGIPGFRVVRFRYVYDLNKNQVIRTRHEDIYPPTEEIWVIGTGPPSAPVPSEPPSKEYTADELLVATHFSGALEVKRKPGRSGTPGWTQNLRQAQP